MSIQEIHTLSPWVLDKIPSVNRSVFNMSSTCIRDYISFSTLQTFAVLQTISLKYFNVYIHIGIKKKNLLINAINPTLKSLRVGVETEARPTLRTGLSHQSNAFPV